MSQDLKNLHLTSANICGTASPSRRVVYSNQQSNLTICLYPLKFSNLEFSILESKRVCVSSASIVYIFSTIYGDDFSVIYPLTISGMVLNIQQNTSLDIGTAFDSVLDG